MLDTAVKSSVLSIRDARHLMAAAHRMLNAGVPLALAIVATLPARCCGGGPLDMAGARLGDHMITGAHAVIFSSEAVELRAFFATVLELESVDAGGGWLIFGLPPSEVAVHPSDGSTAHELYLLCDDVRTTRAELEERGVHFTSPISDEGWGLLTSMRLPGGGELGLYEAKHALAPHPPSGGQGEE